MSNDNDRSYFQLTINSKKLGQAITFSCPGTSYIYADLNGKAGTQGVQLTKSNGSTLWYAGRSHAEFKKICWRWYRNHLKTLDQTGLLD